MNAWQMSQQIKHVLQTLAWSDGSLKVVFGTRSVIIYAGAHVSDELTLPGFPFALVSVGNGTPDADHPDLVEQTFTIVCAAEVAGDPMGEFAVIGGSRADLGKSSGAGICEVSERVRYALQDLTGVDGAGFLLSSSGIGSPGAVGDQRHIALDEITLTGNCSSQPYYAEPQQIAVSGDTWTWSGAHCSSRFDFLQYRLGYVAGSTPAETPGDLDSIVYTGTATTTTHTQVGGMAYSIFADYDPRGTGSVASSSRGNLIGAYTT